MPGEKIDGVFATRMNLANFKGRVVRCSSLRSSCCTYPVPCVSRKYTPNLQSNNISSSFISILFNALL